MMFNEVLQFLLHDHYLLQLSVCMFFSNLWSSDPICYSTIKFTCNPVTTHSSGPYFLVIHHGDAMFPARCVSMTGGRIRIKFGRPHIGFHHAY